MATTDEIEKLITSQKVRIFDMYALGPFLIYLAMQKKPAGKWQKRTLFISGAMTIIYNYKHYKNIKAELEAKKNEFSGIIQNTSF